MKPMVQALRAHLPRLLRFRPMVLAFSIGLAAVTSLAPSPSAAQLPALGDGSSLGAAEERSIGERIARLIYADPDYLDDPVLADYVEGVWAPLLAAAKLRGELPPELEDRFAWQIMLLRDRSINAFALPGGYLGLNLGLIGAVSQRDELASVLAHELSHVTQRHIARMFERQDQQAPLLLGALLLGAVAMSRNPEMANAILVGGQAVAAQQQLNFTRDMEREADRVGLGLMGQAGYQPEAFVRMFERLQQSARLNDDGSFPYLRSHPLTTERLAEMRARLSERANPGAEPPTDMTQMLMAARARVLAKPGADALRRWAQEPRDPAFATQSAPRRAAALYAAALAQQALGDASAAERIAADLVPLVSDDAQASRWVRLLRAELALNAGRPDVALAVLRLGGPQQRESLPRPERLLVAEVEIQRGQPERAAAALQTWLATHPKDGLAWQWLAQAWRKQGWTAQAVRAEGEQRWARLDLTGALDRFRAAQALLAQAPKTPANDIEAAIVDSRVRQTQAALKEELQRERPSR